ncbi:rhodanese-like domain-containing protein [Cryomorphaceae bacterium 1068]|nr:rhodanese-like domain-containing protein [Cryomorphaceae bacterium 1068]
MKEISPAELQQWIENKENFQLVDVRERYEYEISNLGGILIPMQYITEKLEEIAKDKKVVIMCRSGVRSANAIQYLEQNQGFDNLYNLEGGILAYSDEIDSTVAKY